MRKDEGSGFGKTFLLLFFIFSILVIPVRMFMGDSEVGFDDFRIWDILIPIVMSLVSGVLGAIIAVWRLSHSVPKQTRKVIEEMIQMQPGDASADWLATRGSIRIAREVLSGEHGEILEHLDLKLGDTKEGTISGKLSRIGSGVKKLNEAQVRADERRQWLKDEKPDLDDLHRKMNKLFQTLHDIQNENKQLRQIILETHVNAVEREEVIVPDLTGKPDPEKNDQQFGD